MWVRSLGQEGALEEGMATHSSIVDSNGQRSLVGYDSQNCKELDINKVILFCCYQQIMDLE